MKFFFLFFFVPFTVVAQDHYSLYFQNDEVEGIELVKSLPEKFFGEYKLDETESNGLRVAAGDALKLDETGLYIEKNRLLNISREEVRENSQYLVRDGWLHGVMEGDSVQVALSEDVYHFLMPVKTYLFEVGNSDSKCYHTSVLGEYLIVSKEGKNYRTMVAQFNGGSIELKELDYNCESFDPREVEESEMEMDVGTDTLTRYYIDPNEKEWQKIIQCHSVYDSYSK